MFLSELVLIQFLRFGLGSVSQIFGQKGGDIVKPLKKSVLKYDQNKRISHFCVRVGNKITVWVDNGGPRIVVLKEIEYPTVSAAKKAINLFSLFGTLPSEV